MPHSSNGEPQRPSRSFRSFSFLPWPNALGNTLNMVCSLKGEPRQPSRSVWAFDLTSLLLEAQLGDEMKFWVEFRLFLDLTV